MNHVIFSDAKCHILAGSGKTVVRFDCKISEHKNVLISATYKIHHCDMFQQKTFGVFFKHNFNISFRMDIPSSLLLCGL